jgi:LuxR family maltose regulon positive regulatory protein
MISNLLATKLHRPAPPARRVSRPHLLSRLADGLAAGHRLTLVSAPAGFGKTSCVAEWLAGADAAVAWLSLDPADDDPARFFAYLLAAFQSIGITQVQAGEQQTGRIVPAPALTTALLNDILSLGRRAILALDDFHLIRDQTILDAVQAITSGGPDNLHVVLITREDPPLPLARLRANNQMTEIRAADLRFSEDEARRLLTELMGLSLTETDVAAVEERTEGWVAGLQLAGLSMRGQADPAGFIARLSGSHRYILSYLTEEVLDRQAAPVREFLLQTSILGRLSGDLCQAVTTGDGNGETGIEDCGVLLERLCAANLFLVPLDENGEWYRYHHLFGQLLQARLRQTLPADEVQTLHHRASEWFAKHGFADEAIRHALAALDFERAAALVDGAARGMIFAGRMHTLRSWIAAFPAMARTAYPRLEVYRIWMQLLEEKLDLGEKAAQEREAVLQALPPSPENDRLRVELTAVLCRYSPVFGDPARTIRLAEKALAALDEAGDGAYEGGADNGDDVTRARLVFGLAVAHSLEGKGAEATQEFEECVRLAKATRDMGLAAEALGLMAQDRVHCGRLSEAAGLYQTIVDLAGEQAEGRGLTGETPLAGLGHLGLAGIYLERNDLEQAEASLARGMELCARAGLDGIYAGYAIRARLKQARGDLTGALADIETVERTYRRGDDPLLATRRILVAHATGDSGAVGRVMEPWVRLLGAGSEVSGPQPPALVLDVVKVLVARAYLALGKAAAALDLLAGVEASALGDARLGLLIEVYLLEALARQARHAAEPAQGPRGPEPDSAAVPDRARDDIERALGLAEQEGFTLAFLEEAPEVVPLLRAAAGDAGTDWRVRRHAEKLLAALSLPELGQRSEPGGRRGNSRPHDTALPPAAHEPLPIEPLSERELEILRLIGEGCTNQEIAERLVITLHTVKKHSSNIFGKLGVTNRTQAVAKARRLGLLE